VNPIFQEAIEDIQTALEKEYGRKFSESDIIHHAVGRIASQYGLLEPEMKKYLEMDLHFDT